VASDRYSLALLLARTGVAVAHRRLGLVAQTITVKNDGSCSRRPLARL
jgi:hypothetical protein